MRFLGTHNAFFAVLMPPQANPLQEGPTKNENRYHLLGGGGDSADTVSLFPLRQGEPGTEGGTIKIYKIHAIKQLVPLVPPKHPLFQHFL